MVLFHICCTISRSSLAICHRLTNCIRTTRTHRADAFASWREQGIESCILNDDAPDAYHISVAKVAMRGLTRQPRAATDEWTRTRDSR
ncbi:hypothetical protein BKA62DRAFT_40134 [Auriculariales sp. MPI-PUGE-AT-0066]|nr:hypothetical protein BKA62DRAFT_40134 [Auriculariales sp. MPI-PUGE-AT-0066]